MADIESEGYSMSAPSVEFAQLPKKIVRLHDPDSGLDGYIVIDSTRNGPAAGGCRLWHYADSELACNDAIRLAQGMTFKNAMADLPLGGGKAVLCIPSDHFDRDALFQAFGRAVDALDGEYVTAEDVGTTVQDMETVSRETHHVAGLTKRDRGPGGDPSPWTALGVFSAMQFAVRKRLGTDLSQVTVAVQGLGNVGYALCELLHAAGAKLIVAEPRSAVAARAAVAFDAELAHSQSFAGSSAVGLARADVFAPCALGGILTPELVRQLHAKVVCGAANNQLAEPGVAELLAQREIFYAPDYVVNAGGIINVAAEYFGWTTEEVERRVSQIPDRLATVAKAAEAGMISTARAADRLAGDLARSAFVKAA